MPVRARSASKLFEGDYDETAVRNVARVLREELGAEPTFGIVFATPEYLPHLDDFLEVLRLHAHVATLVGSSGRGLIGTGIEQETQPGFSLMLLHLPGAVIRPVHLTEETVEGTVGPAAWHQRTGVAPAQAKAWFVLADPFEFPIERWMQQWNEAYPGIPTFGGLASGDVEANEAWVFLDGQRVHGAVAVALDGEITVETVVSQGCKPIGEPYTITGVDQNILYTLGSQPAYKILDGAFQALTDSEKEKARNNLFAGLAMSEYVEEFKRGDFLVRNIIAADPSTGAVAIAGRPRVGQTLQYQLRDADAASADLEHLLADKEEALRASAPVAAFICTCNGRGSDLFGVPSHDARAVNRHFPGIPAIGFFANGEIGPVGKNNYIHGYSAAIALVGPAVK